MSAVKTIAALVVGLAASVTLGAGHAPTTPVAPVVLAPGDILALQADLLMKVDPHTFERTDYPDAVVCAPQGLARSATGDLFATSNRTAGCSNPQAETGVYHIDPDTGEQTLVFSGNLLTGALQGIAVSPSGNVFVAVGPSGLSPAMIVEIDPDSGVQRLVSSEFAGPYGLAFGATGELYVTDLVENRLSRIDVQTGVRTVMSEGGLLSGLYRAGGVAVGPTGAVYVASVDDEPDVETGLVVRVNPDDGTQTLVSSGQLLMASGTGIRSIAVEPNGKLLVADRRSGFGLIRIDVETGIQTGLDIGASPIDGIVVIPEPADEYEFVGLLRPYGTPDSRQFQAGSTVPLKWQYARSGATIDSGAFQPTVQIARLAACDDPAELGLVALNASAVNALRYDAGTSTWQFNWKTSKADAGCVAVTVGQPELGVTKTFVLRVR